MMWKVCVEGVHAESVYGWKRVCVAGMCMRRYVPVCIEGCGAISVR